MSSKVRNIVIVVGVLLLTITSWAVTRKIVREHWQLNSLSLVSPEGLSLASGSAFTVATPTTLDYILADVVVAVSPTGTHTLYTVPSGKKANVNRVVIDRCTESLNQATDAIVQFGCNATSYNNVIGATTLTAPTGTGTYSILNPTGVGTGAVESTVCDAAATLRINVTTAATSTTTCHFTVFGYLK